MAAESATESAPDLLVVLYGGQSPEHEVSCRSAYSIVTQADPARFQVELLAITKTGDWVRPPYDLPKPITETQDSFAAVGQPVNAQDELAAIRERNGVVFPAMHGPGGEDGAIQRVFEQSEVAYIGSGVETSALCMNKVATKEVLQAAGLEVTPYQVVEPDTSPQQAAELASQLGLPLFVKPATMGSSIGVSRVSELADLPTAIAAAARYSQQVLLETAIVGREIECALLGNSTGGQLQAALPGEVVPAAEFYTYDDKYLNDQAQLLVPASLSPAEQQLFMELAIQAGEIVGINGLARVDFLWAENQPSPVINEINTMPGFTSISLYPKTWQATGLAFPDLIAQLHDLAQTMPNKEPKLQK